MHLTRQRGKVKEKKHFSLTEGYRIRESMHLTRQRGIESEMLLNLTEG
jgi:hypothetical protein